MRKPSARQAAELVFLFDVDNTLLDNDRVQADLSAHLARCHGKTVRDRFWEIFEQLRTELGYADYLGALEHYRIEAMHDPTVLRMANWLVDYPFHERLYPNAIAVVKRGRRAGVAVILSDGPVIDQASSRARMTVWRDVPYCLASDDTLEPAVSSLRTASR